MNLQLPSAPAKAARAVRDCPVCPAPGSAPVRRSRATRASARTPGASRRGVTGLVGAVVVLAAAASPAPASAMTATVAGTPPEAALEPRVGHAYRLATGELVYRVVHEPRVDGRRLLGDHVRYVAPDGDLIARKTVRFGEYPLVPAFRLEILDNGRVAGLERLGGDRVELFNRDGDDGEIERAELTAPSGLVADAGFDLLVSRRLGELKAGETLQFPFAVPSRLTTIDFRVYMVDRREVLGEAAVVVRMEPANVFFRWLVNPIHIAYDADTGALLRYEGLSNLPDPRREGRYRVRIDYPPDDADPAAPQPAEPDEASAARGR